MDGRVLIVGQYTLTPENQRFKHNKTGDAFQGFGLLLEKLGIKKHRYILGD